MSFYVIVKFINKKCVNAHFIDLKSAIAYISSLSDYTFINLWSDSE